MAVDGGSPALPSPCWGQGFGSGDGHYPISNGAEGPLFWAGPSTLQQKKKSLEAEVVNHSHTKHGRACPSTAVIKELFLWV